MNDLIIPLNTAALTLAQAGGKGVNLSHLVQAGFPVPAGFVITTTAYHAFVQANNLAAVIEQQSQTTTAGNLASFETASQAIRQQFEQGEIPPAVTQAIQDAYSQVRSNHFSGPPPVAVRSSATAEDLPEASFAGQQDTYLNVRGESAVLSAVRRCWSSLWTARAMAYRARQGIGPHEVGLAVVVQEMVPAESAGVLFTVNPVTGNPDEIVVNATWGLGEALVAGQVNPDMLLIEKATGRVRQVELGDKQVMTATTASGTAEIAVAAEKRNLPALSPDQAGRLATLAGDIERHFGKPQDIEWAVANGQVYILQARPVTTPTGSAVPPTPPGDDAWPPLLAGQSQPFDLWTQMDVGERWPEPVTPFTWSTWHSMLNENMREADSVKVINEPYIKKIEWGRRAYGRFYFNEGAMMHILTDGFGMPASMMAGSLGSQGNIPAEKDRWQWGKALRRMPQFMGITRKWEKDAKLFEKHFTQIEAWVDSFMARDLSQLSDADLWKESQEIWRPRAIQGMLYHVGTTSTSSSAFGMLEGLVKRWLGNKELAYTLTTGLTGVVTAEIVPTLWQIATKLKDLGLDGVVLANEPAAALAELRRTPTAQPVLDMLADFLQRHGHRCMTEAEWLYPRWAEAPEQVIESVAGYLKAGEGFNPAETEDRQRQQREEATATVEAKLNPIQRAYFRWNLRRAHYFIRMRDNGQHYIVKLALPMRRLFATIAERWTQRGWLAQPDDFFFLVVPEIEAVLQAGNPTAASLDLKTITAERQKAYRYWFSVTIPEVLAADGSPVELAAVPGDNGNVLSGLAASGGKVTGKARVIMTPREATNLQPGEILVTRATDPGWTPVFSVIGGLVLEVGGQLSHGAIVAREYGLPAVVNVPEATRRIEDGQMVTVDGSGGRVHLT